MTTAEGRPRIRPLEVIPIQGDREETLLLLHDPEGLVQGTPVLNAATFELVRLMDGTRTLRDIQADFLRSHGHLLDSREIGALVEQLTQALVLHGEPLDRAIRERREGYAALPHRPARLVGEAYPEDPGELRSFLDGLFPAPSSSPAGPPPRGLVAPHIDFLRGGRCYGKAYQGLRRREGELRILLLGTSHRPTTHPFVVGTKGYATPLGTLELDQVALGRIQADLGDAATEEEQLHRDEHSLEFQAVLLAHLAGEPERIRILPVLCGALPAATLRERQADPFYGGTIETLRGILQSWGTAGLVVAGADLAHQGVQFGDPPVTPERMAEVEEQDRTMLEHYVAGRTDAFVEDVLWDGDARRICGLAPMTALLEVLEPRAGRLESYDRWHDPEAGSMVSFAAVSFPPPSD